MSDIYWIDWKGVVWKKLADSWELVNDKRKRTFMLTANKVTKRFCKASLVMTLFGSPQPDDLKWEVISVNPEADHPWSIEHLRWNCERFLDDRKYELRGRINRLVKKITESSNTTSRYWHKAGNTHVEIASQSAANESQLRMKLAYLQEQEKWKSCFFGNADTLESPEEVLRAWMHTAVLNVSELIEIPEAAIHSATNRVAGIPSQKEAPLEKLCVKAAAIAALAARLKIYVADVPESVSERVEKLRKQIRITLREDEIIFDEYSTSHGGASR
jgi:hypothetical protein